MPVIRLITMIEAEINVCFDLARSIDLHIMSTGGTGEKAVDGRTSGLIELNEFVTWEATHFGVKQRLSSRITAMERPFHFRDEQIKGVFQSIVHDHYFEEINGMTCMKDQFNYTSPFGIAGILFDKIILTKYLRNFLTHRNETIKEYAENGNWKKVLNNAT